MSEKCGVNADLSGAMPSFSTCRSAEWNLIQREPPVRVIKIRPLSGGLLDSENIVHFDSKNRGSHVQ